MDGLDLDDSDLSDWVVLESWGWAELPPEDEVVSVSVLRGRAESDEELSVGESPRVGCLHQDESAEQHGLRYHHPEGVPP